MNAEHLPQLLSMPWVTGPAQRCPVKCCVFAVALSLRPAATPCYHFEQTSAFLYSGNAIHTGAALHLRS